MSHFLGIDYEKEGRGVPEDGSRDNSFLRFFKIIKRKFWAMLRVNLMYVLCSLPAFAIAAFILSYMYIKLIPGNVEYDIALRLFIGFLLVSMQLVVVGPLHAGFIYVIRNYACEEHVFVWSDFIKGIKENWKQALWVTIIDLTVLFIVSYMYMFYNVLAEGIGSLGIIFKIILIVFGVLYAMMHMYIYPMMVTLDLSLKQLYSNALRLAVGKYIPNLLILAVIFAFSLLMFVNVIIGLFIILLIGYSLTGFLSTFYAYAAIEKYVIKK